MNCCNDYGQCTQGHGCPARQACELPIQMIEPKKHYPIYWPWVLAVVLSVLAVCVISTGAA